MVFNHTSFRIRNSDDEVAVGLADRLLNVGLGDPGADLNLDHCMLSPDRPTSIEKLNAKICTGLITKRGPLA